MNESSESNNSSSQQQSLGLPPIVQSGESGVEERSSLLGDINNMTIWRMTITVTVLLRVAGEGEGERDFHS